MFVTASFKGAAGHSVNCCCRILHQDLPGDFGTDGPLVPTETVDLVTDKVPELERPEVDDVGGLRGVITTGKSSRSFRKSLLVSWPYLDFMFKLIRPISNASDYCIRGPSIPSRASFGSGASATPSAIEPPPFPSWALLLSLQLMSSRHSKSSGIAWLPANRTPCQKNR